MSSEPPELQPNDIVYAEYTRLSGASERMVYSSFDDFKLLAIVGAIVGLEPITTYVNEGKPIAVSYLFVGFLGLFSIIAVIAFRDTLKQSFLYYLGEHQIRCEEFIRKQYGFNETNLFLTCSEFEQWASSRHRKLVIAFNFFILLPTIGIPAFILYRNENGVFRYYTFSYVVICLAVYALYFYLTKAFLPKKALHKN
jgi:hypothetical protein